MQELKNRHILLLNQKDKSAIKKTEKEFGTSISSSAELSNTVRAQDIYDSGNALFLKNIGIVILENEEEKKISQFCSKHNTPIRYYEKSKKIFRLVEELKILELIKKSNEDLSSQIKQLEDYIRYKQHIGKNRYTWGLNAISMSDNNLNGKNIDICILDTGFYKDHPDFHNRYITGKSFVPKATWQEDKNGHGTHCTGIAAGHISSENGIRYGIASNAKISIAKVLDDEGNGASDWILDAIDHSIEKKHNVVSLSFGAPVNIGDEPSQIFEHVGQIALQNNCLLIAAAGNDSRRPHLPRPVNTPANCESFMAVAALDKSMNVAHFSNAGINAKNGGKIDISAPGIGVYSSFSPNAKGNILYATLNGTSMASPHVAGLAALYIQAFPLLSASEIWKKLEKKAKRLKDQLIRDVGYGIVQAYR